MSAFPRISFHFAVRQSKNDSSAKPLPFFEIARVLVRLDQLTSRIVNANHKLSEKPKSHLAATAVGCDGVDSVCSVFNGAMNRGDGLVGPPSCQSIELFY
jgi:hypothetical protein